MPPAPVRRSLVRLGAGLGLVLLTVTVWLGYRRYYEPPEQRELLHYFRDQFPLLHAQTKSLQSALVGLIEADGPTPATATLLLDENILPSIVLVMQQAEQVSMATIQGRAIHESYQLALASLKTTAEAVRAIFADAVLGPAVKRERAAALLVVMRQTFEQFSNKAAERVRQWGIILE